MSQYFEIHPTHPQARLIRRTVEILQQSGVIAYPTDSAYALACCVGDKRGVDRIRTIRALDRNHNFTLVCRDLSELATYARVDNTVFRLLKAHTPGPFTFILPATREVPRRLVQDRRKTIGLRVPEHAVPQALVGELGEPLMSVSLVLPELDDENEPWIEPAAIRDILGKRVDAFIDSGSLGAQLTTVVDLTGDVPEITRQGVGDASAFIA